MASIAEFLPWVLPYVAGCSTPLAEQQIRQVCIDFCSHAPVVQVLLDPIDAVQGQTEYDIDTPNGTDVTLILQAFFQQRVLPIRSGTDVNAFPRNSSPGQPASVQQQAGNSFELDRPPDWDYLQAIHMLVATKPTRIANTLADVLLVDAYGIGLGVVGRLLLMPGQAFSNPANARAYTNDYLTARTEARIRADTSFGRAGIRVRPRPFQ